MNGGGDGTLKLPGKNVGNSNGSFTAGGGSNAGGSGIFILTAMGIALLVGAKLTGQFDEKPRITPVNY